MTINDIHTLESTNIDNMPQDAVSVLEIVDKIEEHTIELRKELMRELRPDGNIIHLKLENIEKNN